MDPGFLGCLSLCFGNLISFASGPITHGEDVENPTDLSEQTRYQLNEASDQMKEQLKLALNEDCRILDVFAMGDWTRGKAFEVAKAQREAAKKPGVHQVAPSA
jgi:hypothetical protein